MALEKSDRDSRAWTEERLRLGRWLLMELDPVAGSGNVLELESGRGFAVHCV